MKKLTVLAHKRDTDTLIRRLMRLRCVEIRPSEEKTDLAAYGSSAEPLELEKKLARTSSTISELNKYSRKNKGLAEKRISVRFERFRADGSYAKAEALVDEVLSLCARRDELEAERAKLLTKRETLELWRGCDMPLDFPGTKTTTAFFGTLPASVSPNDMDEALSGADVYFEKVGGDKTVSCLLAICARGEEDDVKRALLPLGFSPFQCPDAHGTAESIYSRASAALAGIEKEKESIEKKLSALSEQLELAEILYDVYATSLEEENLKLKLGATESCTVLSGWVPETSEKRVKTVLDKFECAYGLDEPKAYDDPPVLLRNNFFASCFEWVLGMYSYPKYGSYDPTFIMSIFYFIIFGLMFADVGYGALLVICCFGAIKLLNPRPGMRNFLAMFGYCGISSVIMGVLFGAYFGNMPQAFAQYMLGVENATAEMQTAVLFDPLLDPMGFLIISLGIGAVHLIAGMAIKFVMLCREGKAVCALCDIATWWLLFAGIALAVLFPWGKYVAIAGVLSLVLTQGRQEKNIIMKLLKGIMGLYGIINYISDLLSYSRILALGLAAGVIAQVVNVMGTMGGMTIPGFIMMIAVFLIGHLLNLAINVLGTFVHTSRLQYIEFFGKFYEDGGRPFKAAVPSNKYTTD